MYYDVGANYGNRIEPIINKGLKIIAVEPQIKCIDFLNKKYGNHITIVPKGLGEKEETKTLYISNAHTISSFSEDWIKATQESGRFSQFNWNQEQTVEITTLDTLIGIYGKPKFIKIDVEGFEYEVLKGLNSPIQTISFEYTVPERNKSVLDCMDRIMEIANQQTVLFNYSIGESMEWALDEWISYLDMKKEISTKRFIDTEFGDIYAKTITN
ncbi:MAG: FkbM family methyltransferase [Saprospiraceae bacterium]|nr:FkbM family methyltransferase [Saprospiraceae bacterium]